MIETTSRTRTWIRAAVTVLALAPCATLAPPMAAETGNKEEAVSQEQEKPTFGIAHAAHAEGVLAAGQPTEEQLRQAAAAGYRSVIDLRAPSEKRDFDEPAAARGLGLAYTNLPVGPDLDGATLDRFAEVFEAAERPVLIHCATSNRVGGLLYAYLVLEQGVPEEQALERARAAGLVNPELAEKMRALVRARKAQ
ncbi:MAG TPA: protein tyrosine phosphatase family protein [Thermoanaerobaculia bacterium]|nr:protein tyrosine phosphatase family protein [Thermoanaerobaculia bacterium]